MRFWVGLTVLLLLFIFLIKGILLPFVLGILTAYFLDPVVDRLEQLRISRGAATGIVTACFFVAIGLISILIIPVIASQLSGLIAALPGYISEIEHDYSPQISKWLTTLPAGYMVSFKQSFANLSGSIADFAAGIAAGIFQSGMAVINLLSLILITPVVTFYLLRDWDNIIARADRLLPRKHAKIVRQQFSTIDETLAGFLRGQLNVCMLLAFYYAACLSLTGLKFGAVIGIATGLLAIIPYVGFGAGFVTGMAVAFFQFGTDVGFFVILGVFLFGQALESYFLTPNLVGNKVGLHPVWIIFGMLSGAALFGFVGVLLAIPATAIIGVLIRFAISQYMESDYYKEESATRGK